MGDEQKAAANRYSVLEQSEHQIGNFSTEGPAVVITGKGAGDTA